LVKSSHFKQELSTYIKGGLHEEQLEAVVPKHFSQEESHEEESTSLIHFFVSSSDT